MYRLSIDEDGVIMLPERALKELNLKAGDAIELEIEKGEGIIRRAEKISREEYESLIKKAEEYALQANLDPSICYSIVEEWLNTLA